MTEQAAVMVDTFLRVVGIAFIQAGVQTVCLTAGALFVLGVHRSLKWRDKRGKR